MATALGKPLCVYDDALAVLERIREAGHVAYFAGGCVRDSLLGFVPKDWDVATDAPPGQVRKLFPDTMAVGAAFGVILVRHKASTVEVATFRSDGEYADGRRPQSVRFTTAEEDAKRRDFTINGLFLDPTDDRVIDFVGGQRDLRDRVLRAIGDPEARFAEDHLRLLRAVRFAARFDLAIEPATSLAIKRHAPHLIRISPERIADELRLILVAPTRRFAWRLLRDLGLSRSALRFAGAELPSEEIVRDVFSEIQSETISNPLALASIAVTYALTGDAPATERVNREWAGRIARDARKYLKPSNEEVEHLKGILSQVAQLLADPAPRVAHLKRFLARQTSSDAITILQILANFKEGPTSLLKTLGTLSELAKTDYAPLPLLDGNDLLAMGWNPGPLFKRMLDEVYDAQLEGRISTKEQARDYATEQLTSRPDSSIE